MLASHHGSIDYFDDPDDVEYYYTSHIRKKTPSMTIISVGDNAYGHPHEKALKLYEKYSSGSNKGNKVFRTDVHGNMRAELKDDGGWQITRDKE